MQRYITIIVFFVSAVIFCQQKPEPEDFPKWEEGYLDIHHINTGSGNNCFMVFPDGTTMLFDAGDIDRASFEEKHAPLKVTPPIPSDSLPAEGWVYRYIKAVSPQTKGIDYAVVSHFHIDHYGSLVNLAKKLPFRVVIDRNYPLYNFPLDLKTFLAKDKTFQDYLEYTQTQQVMPLQVGSSAQIVLKKSAKKYDFKVTNVKSNATIWTGERDKTIDLFSAKEMTDYYKGGYNENPLSIALLIVYGQFRYFTGGDNTGLHGYGMPTWFDVETPMAKAVGKVDALTLNHHGNRDATNYNFTKTLDPKVVVQQLWCSDHPGQEVYQRLIYTENSSKQYRDIFATNMHPETLVTYGPWFKNAYKSTEGHVVIRVHPKGNTYKIYVLDNATLAVKHQYTYQSH